MTDGAATLTYDVKGQAQAQGVRVMTYALGSGAEQATCKQIACETGGVFSVVGDGKAQRFAPPRKSVWGAVETGVLGRRRRSQPRHGFVL